MSQAQRHRPSAHAADSVPMPAAVNRCSNRRTVPAPPNSGWEQPGFLCHPFISCSLRAPAGRGAFAGHYVLHSGHRLIIAPQAPPNDRPSQTLERGVLRLCPTSNGEIDADTLRRPRRASTDRRPRTAWDCIPDHHPTVHQPPGSLPHAVSCENTATRFVAGGPPSMGLP